MSFDPLHAIVHQVGHAVSKERKAGNHSKADGWICIGVGILFLPVPIIGRHCLPPPPARFF